MLWYLYSGRGSNLDPAHYMYSHATERGMISLMMLPTEFLAMHWYRYLYSGGGGGSNLDPASLMYSQATERGWFRWWCCPRSYYNALVWYLYSGGEGRGGGDRTGTLLAKWTHMLRRGEWSRWWCFPRNSWRCTGTFTLGLGGIKPGPCLKTVLTCYGEGNDLADDAAHRVPGDALVAAGVPPRHTLYLVEVLRGEVGQVVPVLQPPVLRLRKPCKTDGC